MTVATSPTARSSRLGLRATVEQETVLRRAAEVARSLGRQPNLHMPQVLRAFFVLEPPVEAQDLDLTCELVDADGQSVSERWVYLWKKP